MGLGHLDLAFVTQRLGRDRPLIYLQAVLAHEIEKLGGTLRLVYVLLG